MKIGVPRKYFYEDLDSETEIVINETLKKLKDAGVTLVEKDLSDNLGELVD